MQVALMIPCYIDMFYPHVGIATLELLEKLGVDVVYPKEQTCCGQRHPLPESRSAHWVNVMEVSNLLRSPQ
jgi:heterodisulfide reductase subunit B